MNKKSLKKRIIWIIVIMMGIYIYLFSIAFDSFRDLLKSPYNEEYELLKNSNREIMSLDKVFDFEWDRAYMLPKSDLYNEKLDIILETDCNLDSFARNSTFLTIIFIKENQCIYEYNYDTSYMSFDNLGKFIYPNKSDFKIIRDGDFVRLKYIYD